MNSFDVKIGQKNYERFKLYCEQISAESEKDLTYHWSKRIIENLNCFDFLPNFLIRVKRNINTGLDDNYIENFIKKKIKKQNLKEFNLDGYKRFKFKDYIKKYLLNVLNIHTGLNYDPEYEFVNSDNYGPIKMNFIEKEYGLCRKDFTIYKSLYILNDLNNSINQFNLDNKNILEIGPGVGNLIRCIKVKYKNTKFFLVDLDISLPFSILNILNRFPKSKYILPNEIDSNFNLKTNDLDFIFLKPSQLSIISNNIIDYAFNTMSFQEMTKYEINKYFIFLRKVLKKNNYFYCLNAVEKEMFFNDKKEIIRFSEFPWSKKDTILKYNLSNVHKFKTEKQFFRKIIKMNINEQ